MSDWIPENAKLIQKRWRGNTLREIYLQDDARIIKRFWVRPGTRRVRRPWLLEDRALKRLVGLGRQLEQALIWSVPDFAQMSEAAMRTWWEEAAKMPEDMFASSEK